MKKFFVVLSSVGVISLVGLISWNKQSDRSKTSQLESILSENALALSEREYYAGYKKCKSKCTVYVGARGKVRLLGGNVIQAGADGVISIDGEITCCSGGDALCSPIECIDLYTVIR